MKVIVFDNYVVNRTSDVEWVDDID